MSNVRLDQDYHVYSRFSVGDSTMTQNLRAAEWAGLSTVCLVDRVDAATTWLPQMLAAIGELRPMTQIEILSGVEVVLMNARGVLDLPARADVDHVVIRVGLYPSPEGPLLASQVRELVARGVISVHDVADTLVDAVSAATAMVERPVLVDPWEVLGDMGLDDSVISDAQMQHLSLRLASVRALVEVSEATRPPSHRFVRALWHHDVALVAATASRHCDTIGVYRRVRNVIGSYAR